MNVNRLVWSLIARNYNNLWKLQSQNLGSVWRPLLVNVLGLDWQSVVNTIRSGVLESYLLYDIFYLHHRLYSTCCISQNTAHLYLQEQLPARDPAPGQIMRSNDVGLMTIQPWQCFEIENLNYTFPQLQKTRLASYVSTPSITVCTLALA